MTYYKVVSKQDGTYFSLNAEGIFQCMYSTDEFTTALFPEYTERNYGLTVFCEFEQARTFTTRDDHEIWEVEVEEEMTLPQYRFSLFDLYEATSPDIKGMRLANWPKGTRMFSKVRLKEKVYPLTWYEIDAKREKEKEQNKKFQPILRHAI